MPAVKRLQAGGRPLAQTEHLQPEIGCEEGCTDARVMMDVSVDFVDFGTANRHLELSRGADDSSCMQQQNPGALQCLGQGTGAHGSAVHNGRYDFDDDILTLGAQLYAGLIERAMPLLAA